MPPGHAALATSRRMISNGNSRDTRPLLEPIRGMKTMEERLYDALSTALKRIGLHGARIIDYKEKKDRIIFRYTYTGKERLICLEKKPDGDLDAQADHVNAAVENLRLMGADKFKLH